MPLASLVIGQSTKRWSATVLLLLVLMTALPASNAGVDEILLEMRPEPGVIAHVVRQPNRDVVLRQPFGDRIVLPRPSIRKLDMPLPELRQIDIDFDGHPDLIVHFPEAKPDDPLQILRYLPSERRYETLHLPSSPRTLCNWRNVVPDPEGEVLTLSCQRGTLEVTETVRFNAFGKPWIDTRLLKNRSNAAESYPYISMASQFSRWNEAGQELEVEARDGQRQPVYLTIPVPRTSLYEQPGQKASGDDYLSRGDRVQLLDWMPRWMRISREGEAGTLDRWIWVPDAFDLAAQIGVATASGNTDFALSTGASSSAEVTGSFVDILPIMLTNNGSHPETLNHPELHLLIYDQEGWHVWTQSLLSRKSVTVDPGESIVLEAGPIFVKHGSYTLAHPMPNDFESEIRIFPLDLSPGNYSVRVVLTSPRLGAPVYSDEQRFCHSPAHVPVGSCRLAGLP